MSFTRQIASPRLVTKTITSVSSKKCGRGASARFGQEPFGQGVTLEGLLDVRRIRRPGQPQDDQADAWGHESLPDPAGGI
jgi:hypothetical protein